MTCSFEKAKAKIYLHREIGVLTGWLHLTTSRKEKAMMTLLFIVTRGHHSQGQRAMSAKDLRESKGLSKNKNKFSPQI